MSDQRMALLTLLSPDSKHGADTGLLAADLGVGRREVEKLIAQLQALGFKLVHQQDRVWIDWSGWPHAKQAAEAHLAAHPE